MIQLLASHRYGSAVSQGKEAQGVGASEGTSPGLVATRWFRQKYGEEPASAQEQFMAEHTPLGAVALPEHVAQAVMGFLGMDLVTGENLIVDGGVHVAYGPAAPTRNGKRR